MSYLIVRIAARSRLHARSPGIAVAERAGVGTEYTYALSPDGLLLESQGHCAASLLPRADTVMLRTSQPRTIP